MQPNSTLTFFAKYIETELGIVYAEHNFFQLQNRLEEIAKLLGVDSLEKLHDTALKGITGQFKELLLDTATNNETSFFRDPKVFQAIEQTLLPLLMAPGKKLNIWSAASSSGQEALSLSILIKEWAVKNKKFTDFKITGTDISDRILVKAKKAQYTQLEVQRGLPTPLLVKYFKPGENNTWVANADITQHIHYSKLNLNDRFKFQEKFHFILCRNVLIYQNVERKIDILNRIHAQLEPGGFLILGSGESLIGLTDNYKQFPANGAVIYFKKDEQQKAAA